MYYFLYTLLFLKPSIKKEDLGEQFFRAVIGFFTAFTVFYFMNFDRSLSFIASSLWFPALIQLLFAGASKASSYSGSRSYGKSSWGKGGKSWGLGSSSSKSSSSSVSSSNSKGSLSGLMITLSFLLILGSIGYNLYPYITGGAKNLAFQAKVKESSEQVSKIDATHVIVISPETAYYEMQKMLGTLPNPSVFKIGELGITMTKDGACYVAPIEVDGFFRALTNDVIPGVMYVSAEKPAEAKVINIPSKIAESFVLNRDLERYLRQFKKDAILFQANAELDDEGNPYFVGSYGHYQYGRKGPVIDGVLLFSYKDGKVTDYSKAKVPEWVDQVYPSDVSEIYNENYGTLKKGLLNKFISKSGVHIPTKWENGTSVTGLTVNSKEVTGVIDADGKMKWFTDHTNTSEASTTMTGYSLMDMRTGEMIYYKTPGYINGKGAMNAVDKALGANKSNWAPVQPLFYNLFGSEAWVVPVVNKADGALVKVAIVAAQNGYVVVEDSKDAAINSFKNAIAYGKINEGSNRNANSTPAEEKTTSGKVERINAINEGGNTIFYVKLANDSNIYMVTKAAGMNIVITKENDDVELKYIDIKDNGVVSVTGFVNRSIK